MGTDKPLVSLVVPIYKAQDYLRECVDSLLAQTYDNIEIVLIDDGSPDGCGAICDEYAARDGRINVLHQRNLGVSAARNAGVSASKGAFTAFIDADDWADCDLVEYLLDLLTETDSDIAVCGCETSGNSSTGKVFTGEEALREMLLQKSFDTGPWSKLFKTELVKREPFPENMFFEDLAVMCRIIGGAQRVVYSDRKIYHYRATPDGTMSGVHTERLLDEIKAADMMYTYVTETFPALEAEAASRKFSACCQVLLKLPEEGYENFRKTAWDMICKTRGRVLAAHGVRAKNRVAAAVSFLGGRAIRGLWRLAN